MTGDQLDAALRAFIRRKPFRAFWLEFTSGNQLLIAHPEAVRQESLFYVTRRPDGGYVAFAAESVPRLLDMPITTPS
jgi:hypothetical protein